MGRHLFKRDCRRHDLMDKRITAVDNQGGSAKRALEQSLTGTRLDRGPALSARYSHRGLFLFGSAVGTELGAVWHRLTASGTPGPGLSVAAVGTEFRDSIC